MYCMLYVTPRVGWLACYTRKNSCPVSFLTRSCHIKSKSTVRSNDPVGKPIDWSLLKTSPAYDPKLVEDRKLCNALWDRLGIGSPEAHNQRLNNPNAPVMSMLLPPPNVTGSLHIGHALTCAVQDAIARWYRMTGYVVCWVPGMDHAGIATQAVIERQLLAQKSDSKGSSWTNPRLEMGRERFLQKAWEWKDMHAHMIREQLDCLGLSLDWSREFFTLSPKHNRAVTEAFVRLHQAGLLYRARSLVNWCCHFESSISDIEVDHVELRSTTWISIPGYVKKQEFGFMDYFSYPLVDPPVKRPGERYTTNITVATTRLETMLADCALVVHPNDERYQHLIGRKVMHPFCPNRRQLPIIADTEAVDPTKGTGVVKLSPGHSQIDWEVAERHGLEPINVFHDDGRINEIGGEFQGFNRFDARQTLVERLAALGLYQGREDLSVRGDTTILPICSRSGDVIEPLIREQWFVRTKDLAKAACEAVETGQLRLSPSNEKAVWMDWLSPNNHRDWCVSRQLWWGHQIPAYRIDLNSEPKNASNQWVVARTAEDAQMLFIEQYGECAQQASIKQDPDVLDTWFSSALLPFAVFGWPDETSDLRTYFPITFLETGRDILFFWVARMVMLGTQLTGSVPFSQVILHGLVCDALGKKMSKSRGNVINPLDLVYGRGNLSTNVTGNSIDCIGADSLRASLLSCPINQTQLNYDQQFALDMRRFCNKIWQTAKFINLRLNKQREDGCCIDLTTPLKDMWIQVSSEKEHSHMIDRWLISGLYSLVDQINGTFALRSSLNTHLTSSFTLHTFVIQMRQWWIDELCSVYLEVLKYRHNHRRSSDLLLVTAFLTSLHLLHPIMPHLTEVLWQGIRYETETYRFEETSLSLQSYPTNEWFHPFIHENDDGQTCQVPTLLSIVSSVNAWRPLLKTGKTSPRMLSDTTTDIYGQPLLLQCSSSSISHVDAAVELLTALTRIPTYTTDFLNSNQLCNWQVFPLKPGFQLLVNPQKVDLQWTHDKLSIRLQSHVNKRTQLLSRLKALKQKGDAQTQHTQLKIERLDEQIEEVKQQLNTIVKQSNLR